MTLERWLQEATGTFPPGIRERLAQEYTAHLEDSVAAGGSGDALELFGEPKQVEKSLRKLYYNQKQLTAILRQEGWVFWMMFGLISLGLLLSIALYLPDDFMRLTPIIAILSYSIGLLIMGSLWLYSKNLSDVVKVRFRNQYSLPTLASSSLINSLALGDFAVRLLVAIILVTQLISIPFLIVEDRKLRRTLEVEAASSHQTSDS